MTSDYKHGLLIALGFGLGALLLLLPALWTDSRVIERVEVTGQIVSAAPTPINPKAIAGRGLEYVYVVELSDGNRVRVRDSAAFPHRIGSYVAIERAMRENGTQFYAFSRPGYVPGTSAWLFAGKCVETAGCCRQARPS